ncbi:N-acetylmuramoyl-L-alanine amidase, partial [bacterium]|nr:N-acetylmuramoyl-L-alanine amidase [bacterium]
MAPLPQRRRAPISALAVLLAVAAGFAGCGGPPAPGTGPVIPGYLGRPEALVGRDLSALAGRRIVLDPGHGGRFRGAVGPNGLTEAEVNLGVALHLRGLLEWAGAEVWLTRTADTDFLSPADSSLSHDLEMRVSLSDSLQPDVFLSIHHNSNAALDRTINETQTYYPLDDDGASLDLARAIHRQLVLNLEISPASIRPGNFHVLRHATVPAVLGEPAMISHPVIAERLSLAASQRLEADAYFLGLLDYFAAGLPRWTPAQPDTVWFGAAGDPAVLTWSFVADGPGPDPASFEIRLDDAPTAPRVAPGGGAVSWDRPAALAPRPHTLEVRGRNLAGRATPPRRTLLLPRAAPVPTVAVQVAADGRLGVSWHAPDGGPLPRGELRLGSDLVFPVGPGLPRCALTDPMGIAPDEA